MAVHVGLEREAGGALGALEAAGRHGAQQAGLCTGIQREQQGEGSLVLIDVPMDVLLQLLCTLKDPPAEAAGQSLGQGWVWEWAVVGYVRAF